MITKIDENTLKVTDVDKLIETLDELIKDDLVEKVEQ